MNNWKPQSYSWVNGASGEILGLFILLEPFSIMVHASHSFVKLSEYQN